MQLKMDGWDTEFKDPGKEWRAEKKEYILLQQTNTQLMAQNITEADPIDLHNYIMH